jgi:hypothetical protein
MKKVLFTILGLFLFAFVGMAQNLHYEPLHNTEGNMDADGFVYIDGVKQSSEQLELGVFVGDICRGAALPSDYGDGLEYFFIISGESGDVFTFKLYDHSIGQELDLECTCSGTFSDGSHLGSWPDDLFEFTFVTPTPQPTTYELPITGYTGTADRYYLISSPIGEVRPAEVEGMTTGAFDLYYFDQAQQLEWINIENGNTPLEAGKGYLYANSATTTLRFTGTPYTGTGTFPLSYTEDNPDEIMRGWNLVGNPFPNEASVNLDHYVMNEFGTDLITSSGRVAAMNGIFVKATAANQNVTFSQNSEGKSQVAINVLKDRGAAIDRAIVRFDANSILPKFMLDSNNTKIYIPQSGSQYAVVSSDNVNSLPVNFKARENGNYTLSIDITEVRMEYLHLIDNMTGADVDLLVQPDYHFTASSQDYETRFTLVFRAATGVEEQSQQSFCFVNGRNLYFCEDVEGTTLSLVDMTGRTVRHETLKGNGVSLSNLSEGIYVVRLTNGNNTKVQKIVVK